jgi:hypothetical protein
MLHRPSQKKYHFSSTFNNNKTHNNTEKYKKYINFFFPEISQSEKSLSCIPFS